MIFRSPFPYNFGCLTQLAKVKGGHSPSRFGNALCQNPAIPSSALDHAIPQSSAGWDITVEQIQDGITSRLLVFF